MLKKKLGTEAIERGRSGLYGISYFKIPTSLIIPPSCRRIGPYAFAYNYLEKVIIPESVEVINYCAFAFCEGATIILRKPESKFKEIASNAFYGCKDVKKEVRT